MVKRYFRSFYQLMRRMVFSMLSERVRIIGKPRKRQPIQYVGKGQITFGENVVVGIKRSPYFYDGTAYMEVRNISAEIQIGSDVYINNNIKLICDNTLISIGNRCMIGPNTEIADSDFHHVHPDKRMDVDHPCAPVIIEENVFIGSQAKIGKGVRIGKNSVIASGAIVLKDVPANTVVGGNPAREIKSVFSE